ncbi:MAG: helix-turn-helix transcriptional regulator [Spirochaetaceae bacterium]|nr:helix-turn-helix transcriptional regulator [Spirochaetaceae bacterium]
MDYSQYEIYDFHNRSAFNMSTGSNERSYKQHWHSYGEILLVGPGERNIFSVNQKNYSLVEGDFVLIWPMEMHAIIDADRKESLVIQFSSSFANSLFDMQRIMHFYHNLHVLCIKAHPELVASLGKIANQMKEIFFANKFDREIQCCMLLMQFMMILDEHRNDFATELGTEKRDSYPDDVIRRMMYVTDYIKDNLTDEDLSQTAMADKAGLSKDYFSRIFKNITGQNYSKWLNLIRIEKAITLLSDKTLPLTEVAMLSGFQSIPTFNRVFLAEKGMPPSEYRELYAIWK